MKARKDAFGSVYDVFDAHQLNRLLLVQYSDRVVFISDNLEVLLNGLTMEYGSVLSANKLGKRLAGRFLTMFKWVKSADILVIMDNNKPMLFLKYVGPN